MTNRQPSPGKEGRVRLILDNGQVLEGRMEMADDALEDGSPWAKETVWPDDIAAKFDLSADTLPKDGFSFLGDYNLYWWRKRTLTVSQTTMDLSNETGATIAQAYCVSSGDYNDQGDNTRYSDTIAIDPITGGVVLSGNIKTIQNLSYNDYTQASVLAGKYVQSRTSFNPVYIPPGAVPKRGYDGSFYFVWMSSTARLSVESSAWTSLVSENADAYPKNTLDGMTQYEYLGVPYQNAVGAAKFSVQRYVGNDEAGAESKVTFGVPFYPELLIINNTVYVRGVDVSSSSYSSVEWGDSSVSITKLNDSGATYAAIIFGH